MKWRCVSLEDIATDMQPGFACQPSLDGIPQLRTNNVSPDGRLDLSEIKKVPATQVQLAKYLLTPGDILFNNTNSPDLVGKTAFFDLSGEFTFSNHMTRIRVNSTVADPRYVALFLHWAWAQGAFRALVTQWVNQAAINRSQLASVGIPLPPLSEQRRIVEILDQADRLRRFRGEADAKADRILPALFIKMFGDPATNPMGWPVRALRELATHGPEYGANARAVTLSPGRPRYVRITDIDDNGQLRPLDAVGIDLSDWKQYELEDGDLLFARSGATVGKSYLHRSDNGPCVFAGYLIRFRLDPTQLHPLVAFAFTQTAAYRAWVAAKRRTAAQPNINGQEYASLRLPVPSRSLQDRFVSLFSRIEVVRRSSSYLSARIELLFSCLLRQAFSGVLTASWRQGRMKELVQEMEQQTGALARAAEAAP